MQMFWTFKLSFDVNCVLATLWATFSKFLAICFQSSGHPGPSAILYFIFRFFYHFMYMYDVEQGRPPGVNVTKLFSFIANDEAK
jgi:hypothetical protein